MVFYQTGWGGSNGYLGNAQMNRDFLSVGLPLAQVYTYTYTYTSTYIYIYIHKHIHIHIQKNTYTCNIHLK